MSLIAGESLGKYYGALDVFKAVSFRLEREDRIGLVGANGEGKTTLLRLLAGLEEPTSGQLHRKRGLRLGLLPQDPPDLGSATLWEDMLEVFAELRRLESELAFLAQRLEEPECGEETLERYSALQSEFEHRDGYLYENRIRTVLAGLGFAEAEYERPLSQLSGGQRTRALLARLLLETPELLLLDEPTNHLDLEAVEWLESWLAGFEGSLVVVSHDRYFLDSVVNRTWELAFGGLETYRGNYTAYLRQREERYARRLKEWEAQQEYIAKTEDFVRRFIAGQRTKEAQGRRTRLARFMAEEAVDRPQQQRRIRVQLQAAQRSGDVVLRLSGVAVGYARGRPVLRVPEVEVRRGDRVALVGPNGAGKTTLVRSLLGQLELLEGEIRFGTGVQPGYLAQAHDYLQGDLTVLEAVRQVKPTMLPEQVRGLLGSFLFTGDDAFKRVDELSGGQRSRVALARLVVQDANFLVLDEPTNHLDIASQEVLEEVLDQYPGTLLLVTHDRYLIQALATHVWDAAGGELRCFEGDWAEYLRWRERQESRIEEAGDEPSGRQAQRQAQKEDRRARKQGEKLQQRQQEVEADIHRLEGGLRDLSLRIGQAGEAQDVELVRRLGAEYQRMESALKDLWWQWEQVARELEQV